MECSSIKCWKDTDNPVKNKRRSKYNLISSRESRGNVCVVLLGLTSDWMIKCRACFLANSMAHLSWRMLSTLSENYSIPNYWFKYSTKCFTFSLNLRLNFSKRLITKRKWIVLWGTLIENGILRETKCFLALKFVTEMVTLYVLSSQVLEISKLVLLPPWFLYIKSKQPPWISFTLVCDPKLLDREMISRISSLVSILIHLRCFRFVCCFWSFLWSQTHSPKLTAVSAHFLKCL